MVSLMHFESKFIWVNFIEHPWVEKRRYNPALNICSWIFGFMHSILFHLFSFIYLPLLFEFQDKCPIGYCEFFFLSERTIWRKTAILPTTSIKIVIQALKKSWDLFKSVNLSPTNVFTFLVCLWYFRCTPTTFANCNTGKAGLPT